MFLPKMTYKELRNMRHKFQRCLSWEMMERTFIVAQIVGFLIGAMILSMGKFSLFFEFVTDSSIVCGLLNFMFMAGTASVLWFLILGCSLIYKVYLYFMIRLYEDEYCGMMERLTIPIKNESEK